MISLDNEDIAKINKRVENAKKDVMFFFILMVFFCVVTALIHIDMSIFLPTMALLFAVTLHFINTLYKSEDDLLNNVYKNNNHIKDSIDMFYIPLQNYLMIFEGNASEEVKLKIINEINGHKHLAEPRVQFLFETYLQEDNSKKVSKKLLELTCRDIESLQKQFRK